MAEIDGLLYLPNRARRDLIRALRIPALSEGWQGSFRELLDRERCSGRGTRRRPASSAHARECRIRPRASLAPVR